MSALIADKVSFLAAYRRDLLAFFNDKPQSGETRDDLRSRINRSTPRARALVEQAGVSKTVTLTPPATVGGPIVRDADPFDMLFESYFGKSLIPSVTDTIDEAIGILESPEYEAGREKETRALDKQRTSVPLDYPQKVTVRWLVDHVPVHYWIAGVAALVSLGLGLFAWGFRLGQDPQAVEALSRVPWLERSSPTPEAPKPRQ
jgi:hypothetical protein